MCTAMTGHQLELRRQRSFCCLYAILTIFKSDEVQDPWCRFHDAVIWLRKIESGTKFLLIAVSIDNLVISSWYQDAYSLLGFSRCVQCIVDAAVDENISSDTIL